MVFNLSVFIRTSEGSVKRLGVRDSKFPGSVGLGWIPRFCISNKFPALVLLMQIGKTSHSPTSFLAVFSKTGHKRATS